VDHKVVDRPPVGRSARMLELELRDTCADHQQSVISAGLRSRPGCGFQRNQLVHVSVKKLTSLT
jgi:hypothetical protein